MKLNTDIALIVFACAMLQLALSGCVATPGPDSHPRLLITRESLPEFRERLKREPVASIAQQLKQRADALAAEDLPPRGKVGDIATVRRSQSRIWLLSITYLMTEEERYARRAYQEMLWLGTLPAWMDPRHVSNARGADLATGEACAALGIGYDWTYPALKDSERSELRSILVDKGLQPYVSALDAKAWWAKVYHNWNPVTNGGCGVGALAILGEEEIAERALSQARSNILKFWDAVPSDGGWDEGVAYWQYGMTYGFLFASALGTALGTDDGVFARPGAKQTGYFPVLFTLPDGRSANFSDDGGGVQAGSIFYLLAREYNNPAFYWHKQTHSKQPDPLDIIWMPADMPAFDPASLPNAKAFMNIGWAVMRANPAQPDADICLAFKSGNLAANHSHLDLNSFILVAFGERLAVDPGAGAYVEGYFGPKRWEFYNPSTAAHNTVLVNGQGQQPRSKGEIAAFETEKDYDYLLGRAGDAYGIALSRFDRHIVFVDRRYFVIFDQLEADSYAEFDWLLHTRGTVNASAQKATISGTKAALDLEVISPCSMTTEEGADTVLRIAPKSPQTTQDFLMVLYPRPLDEPGVLVASLGRGKGVKVTLPSGRTDTISFERSLDGWRPRVRIGQDSRPSAQNAAAR